MPATHTVSTEILVSLFFLLVGRSLLLSGIFFQFTAHKGGINVLKVNLPVYRQSDHKLLENNTQITKFDIANLGIKLQDDANRINFGLLIASIVIGIGTVIALSSNVIFSRRQVKTDALFKVFDLLSTTEVRKARTTIRKEYCRQKKLGIKEVKFENTNEIPDLKEQVDLVLSSFDKSSVIVLNKLLDDDSFFDAYGEMIVRDWKTLKSEITMRQQNNPRTLKHFTKLKERFEKRSDVGNTEPYCEESLSTRGALPKGFEHKLT